MQRAQLASYGYPMAARIGSGLAPLVVAPLIVHRFGLASMGLWAIYASASQALTVFDLGLVDCLLREAALCRKNEGSHAVTRAVLALCVGTYLCYSMALAGVARFGQGMFVRLFHIPGSLTQDARSLLWVMPLALLLTGLASISQALHLAAGAPRRFYTGAVVGSLLSVVAAVAVFLGSRPSIGRLALVVLVAPLVQLAMLVRLPLLRRLFTKPVATSLDHLRASLRYGFQVAASNVCSFVANYTDRLFLGAFTSLKVVAAYDVGTRALNLARSVAVAVLPAQLARFVSAPTEDTYDGMERQFAALSATLVLGTLAVTPLFLRVWLGRPPPPYSIPSAVVVAIGYTVVLTTGVRGIAARALGAPGPETRGNTLNLLFNVGVTLALGPLFGYPAVIGATLGGAVVGTLYFHRAWRQLPATRALTRGLSVWGALVGPPMAGLGTGAVVVRAIGVHGAWISAPLLLGWGVGLALTPLSRRRLLSEAVLATA